MREYCRKRTYLQEIMRPITLAAFALAVAPLAVTPLAAQEATDAQIAYVEGNVLSIFYHELGHALIDILQLPVLGQEEDAADTLSVVMINELWEEDYARDAAWAASTSWKLSAEEYADEEETYWGVHGLDLQRHYTHVCLFYGAAPETREDFAAEFELPEERAEGCADEYTLASESWGVFLEQVAEGAPGQSIAMEVDPADSISILLGDEVAALNESYLLPAGLTVHLASCGEANAYYDPSDKSITMCTEYVDYLWDQAAALGL